MSRLKQYINESRVEGEDVPDFTTLQKRIEKDCKKYLKLLKGKDPLIRGMRLDIPISTEEMETTLLSNKVRQDRRSKGTHRNVFKALNIMLEKEGHVRRDKSVLATSDIDHAIAFGNKTYYIFPIGNFNYTWIEAFDFNMQDKHSGWKGYNWPSVWYDGNTGSKLRMQDEMELEGKKKFEDWFTTNKGFDIAYNKGYEIWMDPKEYYILDRFKYRRFWK